MPVKPTPLATRLSRLLRLALHFATGSVIVATRFKRLDEVHRQQHILRWSARLLEILGIRVVLYGQRPAGPQRNTLFVANHISWLDIWALKSTVPVHFVAKSEIRHWPVIGWLAHKIGTLFIERERRHAAGQAVTTMANALAQGKCLCLFPEGTTTDGREVNPFKSSLLEAAINAGATLWPLAIRYPDADGNANTAVAYFGEMTLWQSFWQVLKQPETRVELHFAAPLASTGAERRQLSQLARHAIVSLLHP